MPLSGRALAEAYVKVHADMSSVGPDVSRGLDKAVATAGRGASRRGLKAAITEPLKEGFRDGVRAADPGGQAVGGAFRKGLAGKLRASAVETTKAGQDAGAGFAKGATAATDRGTSGLGARVGARFKSFSGLTEKPGEEAGKRFVKGAGKGAEKDGPYLKKAGRSAGESLLGGFAAIEVGKVAVDFFKDSITAASDLSEAGNKLQVLFGNATPTIVAFGKSAATSLGLSQLAAEDAAATFGVFAKSAGLAGNDAAGFSKQMVGLSADLASFYNTSPEQAIEAIGAALRGESEPIRKYGVLLDDATLRQRAMSLGIISSTKDALKPQQRVLAAQAEILAQTSAAQGDFSRTSGGLANQQRILTAQMENAKAAVGEQLLPVMLKIVSFLNTTAVPAFTHLVGAAAAVPGPIYAIIAGAGGLFVLVRSLGAIRTAAFATRDGIIALGVSAETTNKLLSTLGKGAGIVGLAAISVEVEKAIVGFTSAKVNSKELTTSLSDLAQTGTLAGAGLEAFRNGIGPFSLDVHNAGEAITTFGELAKGSFGGANESLGDWLGRMQSGSARLANLTSITKQYDASLAQLTEGGKGAQAKQVFDQLTEAARAQGVDVARVKDLFPLYNAAVAAAGTSASGATGKTTGLAKSQADAAAAALKQKQATDALTGSLQANQNAILRLRGGEDAYFAAVDAVSGAVKENGRTLDVHSVKGRANRAVIDQLSSAGLGYLDTIRQNTGTGAVFRKALDAQWKKLYDAQLRFGATKQAARQYADQIYKVPKELTTKVNTPGLNAARAGVRGLASDIAHINGRTVTITARADGTVLMTARSGSSVQSRVARAAGGAIPGSSPNKTADNIPVMATAGEHMWSVDEVHKAGGHGAVGRLRAAARAGALHLAGGGAVRRDINAKVVNSIPAGAITRFMDRYAAGWAQSQAGAADITGGKPGPGGGAKRWAAVILQALSILGQPGSWLGTVESRMNRESGGNPTIVNRWDSNWAAGTPSVGLMQVIGPTFRAYAGHFANTGPFLYGVSTNPLANTTAGLSYALHRYHTLSALNRPGGYAAGTANAAPGWGWVGEYGRELVNFRGGEQVKTAAASRDAGGDAPVRLHQDTVAQLGQVLAAAMSRQPVVLDGGTVAGYVDRALGRASMSVRG